MQTVTPEESPPPEITAANLAALAVLDIHDNAPAEMWDRLSHDTRRMWLRLSNDGQGWATSAWYQLPVPVQRRTRLSIRNLVAFLTSVGVDFRRPIQ